VLAAIFWLLRLSRKKKKKTKNMRKKIFTFTWPLKVCQVW